MLGKVCGFIFLWGLFTFPALQQVSISTFIFLGITFLLFTVGIFALRNEEGTTKYKSYFLLILLIAAPILPFVHPAPLRILLSTFAAYELITARREVHRWCYLIFGLSGGIFIGGMCSVASEGMRVVEVMGEAPSFDPFHTFLSVLLPMWQPLVDLTVIAILIGPISRGSTPHALQRSVLLGATLAALFTVVQKHVGGEFILKNQSSFWRGVDRFPGTFTDPNAQGVYLCIALLFFVVPAFKGVEPKRAQRHFTELIVYAALLFAVVLILYAGLLSGSRSFFLGLTLYFIFTILSKKRASIITTGIIFTSVILFGILWNVSIPSHLAEPYVSTLPTGARRILAALSVDRISETLFSRSVFFEMNWSVLREYGVWGIGIGRFRYFSPALAEIAGYDLRGWIDNSNNFYLGTVSELGVIGTALLLCASMQRKLASKTGTSGKVLLLSVLTLLITGPHVEAPEVGLLYAVVIGTVTVPRVINKNVGDRKSGIPTFTLIILPLIFAGAGFAEFSREIGGYMWEREGHGMHQWLSPVAKVQRACDCHGKVNFILEVASASKVDPMVVEVTNSEGASAQSVFTRAGVQRLSLDCAVNRGEVRDGDTHYPSQAKEKFVITTNRGWYPGERGGNDPRVFGVRLRDRVSHDLVSHPVCPAKSIATSKSP